MGEHLTLLLCETKHRGAFEQAYVGFCKLTSRLWSFPDGSLHMIPRKWLKQTLEEIANYKRLCTTRRSAGVPFMIQALVCTELSVGGGSCFSSCMEELLALTRQEHTHSTEACTHALNILRALFRNSQLGEAVSCYVEASFITAMNMFKSSAWSERNAATLLLAALMTRVFGVPRTKGTALSWKNRMTGRIFFQRYPQLYGYLLTELRSVEASQCTVKPTIYPALLLLSRLYPSSLEGTDSNLKLDAFIPAITNCASSTVMKTRLLSARAIVSLVTPDIFVSHLKYLFTKIFDSTKENTTHGLLLQAIELLRSIPTLSDTDEDKLKQESEQWISHISKIFESKTLSNSLIVCSAYIVVLSLLHSKYVMKSNELWLRLGSQIEKHLFSTKKNSVGENEFAVAATDFLLEMMVKNVNQSQKCREKVAGLNIHLVCLLSHKLYEVKNKAFDFMLYLLKPYDDSDDCFDFGTPTSLLKDSILNSDVLSRMILSFFFSSKIHTQDFLKVLEVVTHHPKALTFVKKSGGLDLILDLCRSDNETTVCLALECLLKALHLMEPDSKADVSCYNLELICDIVVKNCSPESNLDYRIVITKWFNSESFTILPHLSDLNRLRLWNALMRLCCDEDLEVHAALFSTFCQVKTIHLFMSKFVIEETSDIVKMMALTAWTVGTFDLEIFNNEPDDKAFDSGELSATFEEPVLSAIAAGHLQNFLIENDKLMKTEIGEEFISWMASSCGIGALAIARTISDIGNIIETEISQKSAQLGTSYCNFLKPGFKTIVLSQIKMKNLSQYS
ncbi:thyroid adenoma-associated protein homolog [Nilaparvata lugens]|uniref:thyroid adenoma-associated protein homolog n=1 Tax=Nilaparvata lugens TaxID=108931 RepID=UPI00193D03F9|nr:thyroid adenoma-associated protein homolog [Nilaparvata lugens]